MVLAAASGRAAERCRSEAGDPDTGRPRWTTAAPMRSPAAWPPDTISLTMVPECRDVPRPSPGGRQSRIPGAQRSTQWPNLARWHCGGGRPSIPRRVLAPAKVCIRESTRPPFMNGPVFAAPPYPCQHGRGRRERGDALHDHSLEKSQLLSPGNPGLRGPALHHHGPGGAAGPADSEVRASNATAPGTVPELRRTSAPSPHSSPRSC